MEPGTYLMRDTVSGVSFFENYSICEKPTKYYEILQNITEKG